jgi:hypothetical protein
VQGQIKLLKEITDYLYDCTGTENNIYYTVENNTLGEAALLAISEFGEENIRGQFVSEPAKTGQARRYRKGFNTTQKSKLAICAKFKHLLETKKIHIVSKNLISELKVFVASGGSYAAKVGETDDLVMSILLALRIVQYLQGYDVELDKKMKDQSERIDPMPFIMI